LFSENHDVTTQWSPVIDVVVTRRPLS